MEEIVPDSVLRAVGKVFWIESFSSVPEAARAFQFKGRFLYDSEEAYALLSADLKPLGYTPFFREDEDGPKIIVAPGVITESPPAKFLSLLLFALTLISVVFTGVFAGERPSLLSGLLFAIALLGSLGAHELGHYFVSRKLGSSVSLPYFIPMPFSPFGTMGAIIRMKSPPLNRRTLIRIGAAGPLAGLVVGIPMTIIGLMLSKVETLPANQPYYMEGNSILYLLIKLLLFDQILPSGGKDVFLHPMAFAGWASLMVTGLNLIPAGQLDGGHIAYAFLGKKAKALNWIIIGALLLMGFWWQGWFIWAFFIALLGREHARPLDEVTPLKPIDRLIAIGMFLIFVLLFTPRPLVLVY